MGYIKYTKFASQRFVTGTGFCGVNAELNVTFHFLAFGCIGDWVGSWKALLAFGSCV